MRINWFSPLPPAATDIAHYTMRTLGALGRHAQVTLWTDQPDYDRRLEKLARVRQFRAPEINWTEFNRADVSFYHIGNNPLFHGGIWQLSRRAPGIVVLHDLRLHHFFDGIYRDQRRDRAGYLALMKKYYGAESLADAAACYDNNAANINEMAERYPLTRAACAGALGLLTHTREAFSLLKKEAQQPVAFAPLPFPAPPPAKERPAGPPFRLIVFGYLGRNRRLAQIFAALGGMAEKEQFRLDVYGEVADRAEIEAAIDEHSLRSITKLHGFAPENKLDTALRRSHLAFNLRFPTMGEASGSQLRIWSHALPALVTRVGWYADMPADTALFVRPEREVSDIRQHLRDFLAAPESFAATGARGREILETQHAPEIYADALLELARQVCGWRGRVWAYDFAPHAAALAAPLHTTASLDFAQEKTAREIALLAGWEKPSMADYAPITLMRQPAAPQATWRERLQAHLDRWFLGASVD